MPELIDRNGIAEMTGHSRFTVNRLCITKGFPSRVNWGCPGKKALYDRRQVQAFLDARKHTNKTRIDIRPRQPFNLLLAQAFIRGDFRSKP